MKKADQRAGSAGKPVTRLLSNILTVVTILAAAALVLALVIDPLIDAALGPLIGPLIWTLAVLIAIRLLLNVRRLGLSAAAPLLTSASVQSGFFGFPPGASRIEESGAAAYTISETADDPQRNRPDERLA